MNSKTNIKTIGVAAALTTVIMWLLGFYLPSLMAAAPVGLEAAVTGLFSVLVGYVMADPDERRDRNRFL